MLSISVKKDSSEFNIGGIGINTIQVNIVNAYSNFTIQDNNALLSVSKDVKCFIYSQNGMIICDFSQLHAIPRNILLKINEDFNYYTDVNTILMQDGNITASLIGLTASKQNEYLYVRLGETSGRIIFELNNNLLNIQSMSANSKNNDVSAFDVIDPIIINSGRRWPEWAISVYDYLGEDGVLRRPRPIRFDVPIISTVANDGDWKNVAPADGSSVGLDNQEIADIEQIKSGRPAPHRTVHFLATCNQTIDSGIVPNLLLYLPSGIDTVRYVPEVIPMSPYGSSGRQYHASYIFHVEDGDQYVDGYTYLSIAIPLHIIRTLPIRFRYKTTGYGTGGTGLDDPQAIETIYDTNQSYLY